MIKMPQNDAFVTYIEVLYYLNVMFQKYEIFL